ncbi:glycoside hydrolase [Basidiobolus meristosporus CBS 931.73]|uniref:Chitinase domain-containing protein 1 n=1 Tax=Basidiobolus meristosporus CBS 931.73 TaxID=1314790 RepID=A0A1Y1ZDV2_9FUNG|nr:glycoside hydrolase [Basidiobolus meristosporus CBS 931.73]|eukprot:ORY08386.1 glycoside hydrolase [Basidiobolus meristosporus CBS 931.73]
MFAIKKAFKNLGHRAPSSTALKLHAWIYYGAPGQDAPATYKRHKIDVLRVQYFNLLTTGQLERIDEDPDELFDTQNGFSEENVRELKQYSTEQLVTVAGHVAGLRALTSDEAILSTAVSILVDFVTEHQLTGVDIDFESYGKWTGEDYAGYKAFLSTLGARLHSLGKKLAICAPVWTTDHCPLQWRYEDFVPLPVDYITPMIYDYQWDHGGGQPICPLAWLKRWTITISKIIPNDRLVIGIPSYSYCAVEDEYEFKNLTLDQVKDRGGYAGGRRDPLSAEIVKKVDGLVYVINDQHSLNVKRTVLENLGVKQLAVWHLGGNDWF